jgi:hypothetical protein
LNKEYYDPTFQFKGISKSSAIDGEVIIDGNISEKTFTVNRANLGGAGFGAMLFGVALFGTATGGSASENLASDQLVTAYGVFEGRSIKYAFNGSTVDLYFKFLALYHDYQVDTNFQYKNASVSY